MVNDGDDDKEEVKEQGEVEDKQEGNDVSAEISVKLPTVIAVRDGDDVEQVDAQQALAYAIAKKKLSE